MSDEEFTSEELTAPLQEAFSLITARHGVLTGELPHDESLALVVQIMSDSEDPIRLTTCVATLAAAFLIAATATGKSPTEVLQLGGQMLARMETGEFGPGTAS